MDARTSVRDKDLLGHLAVACLIALAIALGGCKRSSGSSNAQVAATSSYLEAVAKDLLGRDTSVLRLAGPGMCPGHFDISPSQINELRRCRLLLRFDFHKSMDAKLAHLREAGLSVAEVRLPGGLCEPSSYMAACRHAAEAIVAANLLDRSTADARLSRIAERLEQTESRIREQLAAAKLTQTPVVASVHQAGFGRWLGLNVVATFRGADVESPRCLDKAIHEGREAGARLVIANLPEGRRAADAIAERLGASVVAFGNFPEANGGHPSFDDLVATNVARLVEAAAR